VRELPIVSSTPLMNVLMRFFLGLDEATGSFCWLWVMAPADPAGRQRGMLARARHK
jgi:hypothetical protein